MFIWVVLLAMVFVAIFDGFGTVHAIEAIFLEYGLGLRGTIIIM